MDLQNQLKQAISTQISDVFEHAARYKDMMAIFNNQLHKVDMWMGYENGSFIVFTTNTGLKSDEHYFPVFAQAFDFALKTYTEKSIAK